ncbi:polycomb group RING finger protein 3-like isoform X2 [Pomacea canaliculata]|nr:polycomb group RING finger protein 3-like isoform X2 [Pomacea canaliculata]XP_025094116.1 polycomb group RING finger protein 3-like isoform X2 [Pomacea canaliculata]XP_025094117.1 polycomb group RING finger protein 3-like isoform X2 [Pomacea canaliculata]XP_025094118.1 polycomb group RING finger protein 3-like isoform X2 [Pomacea canaliculata]XP_025094119.1 polycomb group RING finger protein 3-like isoform X2 [Pomacea canaliculata]
MADGSAECEQKSAHSSNGSITAEKSDDLDTRSTSGKNRIDATNTLWLPIKNINQYITCGICYGYLYEASTVTECMHSFCKNCIVRHVERSLHCPTCHILIHPTDPFVHIRLDRLLQDIVYGLLPHLAEDELAKKKKFYADCASDSRASPVKPVKSPENTKTAGCGMPQPASSKSGVVPVVSLVLQCRCTSSPEKVLEKKFIRVTGLATVQNLVSFLRKKLLIEEEHRIDVYCCCGDSYIVLETGNTMQVLKDKYFKNAEFVHLEFDIS